MRRRHHRRKAVQTWVAPLVILLLGMLSCISDSGGEDVPRQRWWDGDGIVVPHDSFPADCALCHIGDDWNAIREDFSFDHLAETGVELEGRHAEARCLRCHNDRGPVALFAQRGCRGCHEDVHEGLLGNDCANCHGQDEWRLRDEIAMHNRTRFPLVGAHAAAACWSCHPGGEVGNWSFVDISCAACHLDDALSATIIDHDALGWTRDCDRCHIPTTWTGSGFHHGAFPLTGAHRGADCAACHAGGIFTGLPRDCAGCHLPEYNRANDPNHVADAFPMTCELCHDTSSWEGAMFSHAGISNGCFTCHATDYNGAPDHVANGYPTDCEQCHDTASWQGADFNHVGFANGCVTCHLPDYNGANDPDHVANGFSTSCEECHDTGSWEGATFGHVGVTNGCVNCHLADYNGTTSPNHSVAGFPTSCESCHDAAGWIPADFNHDFPIDSGDHSGFDCADCHLTPASFADFSCTHCHEHRQSEMDDKHSGEPGYVWESGACYSCHPNGNS